MDNDEISVAEIQELVKKVEAFCAERPGQRSNMIWLADVILKRLSNDLDYYVNIEGQKGYGKSNCILLLALLQCRYSGIWKNEATGKEVLVYPRRHPLPAPWKHIKFGFQFVRNMSFLDNTDVLKKKFFALGKYHPFIIDEGSKNLHKYQWATKLQFLLVRMSDTERYQNKSFYVCFPNFKELNSTFRNDRVGMRIYIYSKNVTQNFASAIISLKDVNRHISDPWHTEENAKEFERILNRVPIANRGAHNILYAEKKLMGFAGDFDIPNLATLSPRIWEIYMRYKIMNAQKENIEVEEEDDSVRVTRWKTRLMNLINYFKAKDPTLTDRAIADIGQMTIDNVQQLKKTTKDIINASSLNSKK